MTHLDNTFWDYEILRSPPAVHGVLVGGEALLFDEGSQQLYGQNSSSAAIWNAICRTGTVEGAARALADDSGDHAAILNHTRLAVYEWLRMGFLRPESLGADREYAASVRLGWRGRTLEVRLRGNLDERSLNSVFQPFVSLDKPERWLAVEEIAGLIFMSDDRGRCRAREPEEFIPELKTMFTETVVAATQAGFLVHAALLSRDGKGLLICGEPGAGKTTLSISLILAGFNYHSDDVVWVGDEGEVIGIPFAPALKEGAWHLMAEMEGDLPTSAPYLRNDGQRVRYVLERPVETAPIELQSIILLERCEGDTPRVQPVTGSEVLKTILNSAYSSKGAIAATTLKALVDRIESARTGRLYSSDWRENRRLVEQFFA